MVVLPNEFVATKYPGYFWNTATEKLYSIKVTGELRRLVYNKGGYFNGHLVQPGYQVSHEGTRRRYTLDYLKSLAPTQTHQVINIAEEKNDRN